MTWLEFGRPPEACCNAAIGMHKDLQEAQDVTMPDGSRCLGPGRRDIGSQRWTHAVSERTFFFGAQAGPFSSGRKLSDARPLALKCLSQFVLVVYPDEAFLLPAAKRIGSQTAANKKFTMRWEYRGGGFPGNVPGTVASQPRAPAV